MSALSSLFKTGARNLKIWHNRQKDKHPILLRAGECLGLTVLGLPFGLLPASTLLTASNFAAAEIHKKESEKANTGPQTRCPAYIMSGKTVFKRRTAAEAHICLGLIGVAATVMLGVWHFDLCELSALSNATKAVAFEMGKVDADNHFLVVSTSARGKSDFPKAIGWSFAEAKASATREETAPTFFTVKSQILPKGQTQEAPFQVILSGEALPEAPQGYEINLTRLLAHRAHP